MFKSFVKNTLRHLWKAKTYGFLNIFGLAIGIACAALIFLWVEDEWNFNHYFGNRSHLYKVKDSQTYDGTTFTFDATPGPLAHAIQTEIPGIKNAARSTWYERVLFTLNDKTIYEPGLYVDSSFLTMFGLQFVKGNAAVAFTQLHSLVLTETMAKKFFGTTDIIGKELKVDNKQDYTITGVIKDMPENTSFYIPHWLAPFKIYEEQYSWLKNWTTNTVITYVETDSNSNIAGINSKLDKFVLSKAPEAVARMSIYPMDRWRLYDNFDKNGKEIPGRVKYVNLFSLIAWIVLIIACINFMNLATARSLQRVREVGVRKTLGAERARLILQFIGESIIIAFLATAVAVALVYCALPGFSSLVEKKLTIGLLNPLHIGALLSITLFCGLVAGSYPAFYLSSFKPVNVLKGLKMGPGAGAAFIRKALVVGQFTVSVILIISTIIIYQQIQHAKNKDIGYNKQDLVYLEVQGRMANNFSLIKNDLLQTDLVENASLSSMRVLQIESNGGGFKWAGKDPRKELLISMCFISPEFIPTAGLHLKEGRDFYPNTKVDSNSIIINETLAKTMHQKNIIGSVIASDDGNRYTVVGVVSNFAYNNLYASPTPLIFFSIPGPDASRYLTVRFKPGTDLQSDISKLEAVLKKDNPGYPVEYRFMDKEFDQFFRDEIFVGKLAGIFAMLTILISCLGLFGLAAYTAERRTKEIGIRKVLGASFGNLAILLSRDFMVLVIISCLIAFPVAWKVMYNWLQDFEYRIQISWWIFLASGVLALMITLITVGVQTIKAALANPVTSLRSE